MASAVMTSDQLAELVALRPGEQDHRLEQALREETWADLAADIGEGVADLSHPPIDCATATEHLKRRGYFHSPRALDEQLVARLERCVTRLKQAGWPLVFAYVYDAFWEITRSAPMQELLAALLGTSRFRQLARVWVHHVGPGGAGWVPHVDGWRKPSRVTLWIPLTEATVENGCIYIVPRDRVPEETLARFVGRQPLEQGEVAKVLQAARALPASPGAVLGWDFSTLHWGSRCAEGAPPRISMAAEFIGSDDPGEVPTVSMDELPTFRERLQMIASLLLLYDGFELVALRHRAFAERLHAAASA